jgi:putative ABC transport system permease protein
VPTYLTLSFKSLASSVWRWLFTLIAIALGVAGIVASLSINHALTDGNADAEVLSLDEAGFSEDAVAIMSSLPQVAQAVPRMSKVTTFREGDNTNFIRLIGIDTKLDPDLHPIPLLAGQALTESLPDAVLVPETWAGEMNLTAGDTFELMTGSDFKAFQVEGIVGGVPDLVRGDAPYAFISLEGMRAHFGTTGARISQVSIRYSPQGASSGVAAINNAVPEPHLVQDLKETEAALLGGQRDFRWLLALFGAIVLAGSGMQVLNTLSILSHRRSRELAMLRIAGALRRQVLVVLLLEAMIVGLAGSVAGVALGALLVGILSSLVQEGRGLQLVNVSIDPVSALTGLALGVLVSVVAALIPAIEASRREPLDALRSTGPASKSRPIRQLTLGVVLLLLLVGVTTTLVATGDEASIVLLFLGFAGALLLALLLLLLAIVPLLIRLVGSILQRSSQGLTYIAQQSLVWRTNRTASTASALSVAVALLTALLTLAGSTSTVGRNAVAALFAAPYVIVAPEPLLPNIVPDIERASGAEAVSPLRWVTLRWDDRYVQAVALDPQFYAEDPNTLPLVEGNRAAALTSLLTEDAILIPDEMARREHLHLGSLINIWTPTGERRPFKVVGLLRRSFPVQDPAGALVISQRALKSYFNLDSFTHLLVRPSGDNFGPRLEAAIQQYGLQVRSTSELSANIELALSRTLWLFTVLTATAALVGTLSIVNTMNLNVLERARVIDLLRAAGMTTRQVVQMVLTEGLFLGLLSGLIGVSLGLGLGWLLFGAGRISQDAVFAPPLWILLLVPAAGLLTFLAAVYPARAAAARSVLGSVRSHME